jgi:hypothetical protein
MSYILDDLLSYPIDIATSGDNTILSAISGEKVYIHGMWLWANDTVTITFKEAAGTKLAGAMALVAQDCPCWDIGDIPWFVTTVSTPFIINLSAAVQLSGIVYYRQEA